MVADSLAAGQLGCLAAWLLGWLAAWLLGWLVGSGCTVQAFQPSDSTDGLLVFPCEQLNGSQILGNHLSKAKPVSQGSLKKSIATRIGCRQRRFNF